MSFEDTSSALKQAADSIPAAEAVACAERMDTVLGSLTAAGAPAVESYGSRAAAISEQLSAVASAMDGLKSDLQAASARVQQGGSVT